MSWPNSTKLKFKNNYHFNFTNSTTNKILLTESAVVMRRQKQMTSDDEDRPMRRVSYLRATANENSLQLQGDSDMDNSPMSAPADTPDIDIPLTQLLKRLVHRDQFHFIYIFVKSHLFQYYICYIPPKTKPTPIL